MPAPVASQFTEHSSGILIPAGSFDKHQRTLLAGDFRKLKRVLAFAVTQQMRALFACRACNAPIEIKSADQIVTEITDAQGRTAPAGGGRFTLACACTVWTIR